jgi:thiamine transport system permease protein
VAYGNVALRTSPGWAAATLILGAISLGVLPLLWLGMQQGFTSPSGYLYRVVAFTLEQAFLSTALAIAIGLPVARALARRRFPGRNTLIRLMVLPQALPQIVAVLGIVGIYGNGGWLPGLFPIYGLPGILLAHVFFNMPLAVRLILTRLEAIPPENFRLAQQLDIKGLQLLRLVEWPQIRGSLAGIAALIFLLCMASFTVVLILGGGPASTTLEVAIYQALKLDFDPALAAVLALAQLTLSAMLIGFASRFAGEAELFPRVGKTRVRSDGQSMGARGLDAAALCLAAVIIIPPLVNLIAAGVAQLGISALLVRAIVTSAMIGIAAAAIATLLGWAIAAGSSRVATGLSRSLFGLAALAGLMVPPAVIATGWFIALIPLGALQFLALPLIVALSSLMALPFAGTTLKPAIAESHQRHDRLCESLGLNGLNRLWLIDARVLRRPLALGFLFALLISLGDLTAVLLLGSNDIVTLPALIYRQMGQYRFGDAAGTALVLALFCFGLSSLAQRWSTAHDPA